MGKIVIRYQDIRHNIQDVLAALKAAGGSDVTYTVQGQAMGEKPYIMIKGPFNQKFTDELRLLKGMTLTIYPVHATVSCEWVCYIDLIS